MASRKLLMVGDLVEYVGQGTEDYKSTRRAGVVVDKQGAMIKVTWANEQNSSVWYQRNALRRLTKDKKQINSLTNSSNRLNYSNNTKEYK